jgi:hypothetical protein
MTSFKRNVIVTIAALFVIGIAMPVSADLTGNLTLTGNVAANTYITVTPEAVASNLDLTTTQTGLKIAAVREYSNRKTGYSVTLHSTSAAANAGTSKLYTTGVSDAVVYTLTYGGVGFTFNGTGDATITTLTGAKGDVTKDLNIIYTGQSFLSEGAYGDTLLFTIAAP